jgi:hypothetical protein
LEARGDLLLSRNFAQLPKLMFLVLKIKHSSKSKHHRLTTQPKAEEKCLLLNFLAHRRIYERFQCFEFPHPVTVFPYPPELGVQSLCWLVSMVTLKKSDFF